MYLMLNFRIWEGIKRQGAKDRLLRSWRMENEATADLAPLSSSLAWCGNNRVTDNHQ